MAGVAPASVLVLAGQREGERDALRAAAGADWKALIAVGGVPMLARVADALAAAFPAVPVTVSGLPAQVLAQVALPAPARALAGGSGPAESVARAFETGGLALPALVTTADHALLTPAMLAHFAAASAAAGADMTVGLAEQSVIEAAWPGTRRTYLRLGGRGYSGCNLFWVASPRALAAIRFWRQVEADRKRPWRIARRFGPGALAWLALTRPGPERAFAFLSRRIGARVAPVILPFAEAAIDVDKPEDLALAEAALARRQAG